MPYTRKLGLLFARLVSFASLALTLFLLAAVSRSVGSQPTGESLAWSPADKPAGTLPSLELPASDAAEDTAEKPETKDLKEDCLSSVSRIAFSATGKRFGSANAVECETWRDGHSVSCRGPPQG